MIAKSDTPAARATYRQRLAMVEPVFGNVRSQKRLDHFTLRGKSRVNILRGSAVGHARHNLMGANGDTRGVRVDLAHARARVDFTLGRSAAMVGAALAHGVLRCRAALSDGPLTCPKGIAVEALGPRLWRHRGDGHRVCVDLHADAARARLRQG